MQKILVLAPHTDDAELGCGASLARFLEEGAEIHVAAFSVARASLPNGADPNMLRNEFLASMQVLGIPSTNVYVYDYEVRMLSYHRQEVLDDLIKLRSSIHPDLVFLPSGTDLHQDHQVVYNEGIRAYKNSSIWGYELPWNQLQFATQAFVTLKQHHIDIKWEMMTTYKSQFQKKRPYFTKEFMEGLARVRGVQVNENYAEAFEIVRLKV